MKTVGGLRKTRHCGRTLVEWFFVLTAPAQKLVYIPKIFGRNGMSLSGSGENVIPLSRIRAPIGIVAIANIEKTGRKTVFQQPARLGIVTARPHPQKFGVEAAKTPDFRRYLHEGRYDAGSIRRRSWRLR